MAKKHRTARMSVTETILHIDASAIQEVMDIAEQVKEASMADSTEREISGSINRCSN